MPTRLARDHWFALLWKSATCRVRTLPPFGEDNPGRIAATIKTSQADVRKQAKPKYFTRVFRVRLTL